LARPTDTLLLGLALVSLAPLGARDPEHVNIAFSQAAFPDVSVHDVESGLSLWSEELSRHVAGIQGATTHIYSLPETVVTGFRDGSLDLAILPTLDFFKLESRLNAEIGFVGLVGSIWSQRYLLVAGLGAPSSLEQLKGQRFCYAKDDAVGLLFLNTTLLRAHLPEMDRFFRSADPLPRGSQGLTQVYFGKADVCLISESAYRSALALNPSMERKLRTLMVSPVLHSGVAVYRKDYPRYMRERIQYSVNDLRHYPRGDQILKLFRVTEIRPYSGSELGEVRKLYLEYRQRKGRLL